MDNLNMRFRVWFRTSNFTYSSRAFNAVSVSFTGIAIFWPLPKAVVSFRLQLFAVALVLFCFVEVDEVGLLLVKPQICGNLFLLVLNRPPSARTAIITTDFENSTIRGQDGRRRRRGLLDLSYGRGRPLCFFVSSSSLAILENLVVVVVCSLVVRSQGVQQSDGCSCYAKSRQRPPRGRKSLRKSRRKSRRKISWFSADSLLIFQNKFFRS